ncbi:MAG: bifunctional diaminohydroxyphosphoribosylaminopyrimidine deaminase/5-amino-6-(5-phosphoribosylamino)uracil reductase RibD [Bacteroidota bacterium]
MQRCLQLAQLGAGNVAPNPMVGAVLVYEDTIIGEGYHQEYGQVHAEVNCLNSVSEENRSLVSKSTLYVSLEPCAHFGKTPPCTDLIIKMQIPKVVIACRDSYKEVDGKGIEKLKAAGTEVVVAVLENEAKEVNRRFFTFHEKQRPYIFLKWAQSSDHKIANADHSRVLISNDYTNRLVHKWRSEEAAIMIGTNTALYDDPCLTNRLWTGNDPVRVVIDKELKIPATHHLVSDGKKMIIFNTLKQEDAGNLLYRKISIENSILQQVMASLYEMKIQSVLVEGGTRLLQSFIDEGLWDEASVITNNTLVIKEGIASPVLKDSSITRTEPLFSDTIYYYKRILQ